MKSLKSKLFQELELNNANSEKINGGNYTSNTQDTSNKGGTGYDVLFDTDGTIDSADTSHLGTTDIPLNNIR